MKAFAQPDAVLNAKVPYFYTRAGFEKFYTVALAKVQIDIAKDAGVLEAMRRASDPISATSGPGSQGCTRAISSMRGRR